VSDHPANAELIEGGDLDELVRHVDRLCAASDWDGLLDLRDRARRAVERGKQLWPAASLVEYRLALEAPGPWAGVIVSQGSAGYFARGPLAEVAASTHAWAELAPHAGSGPAAAMAAHERVVRGEDLDGDGRVPPGVLELPLRLQEWEPAYAIATYHPDKAEFPAPPLPRLEPVVLVGDGPESIGDPEACRAFTDLTTAWSTESNGSSDAICVEGDAVGAVRALGYTAARIAPIESDLALAHLAWAGASGGAHGRRRGMATGRFGAWWALAAVAGVLDHWPVPPAELDAAAGALRWFAWDDAKPSAGWSLRLAVEHADEGLAWAVDSTDSA
jgi:hypothetical protein